MTHIECWWQCDCPILQFLEGSQVTRPLIHSMYIQKPWMGFLPSAWAQAIVLSGFKNNNLGGADLLKGQLKLSTVAKTDWGYSVNLDAWKRRKPKHVLHIYIILIYGAYNIYIYMWFSSAPSSPWKQNAQKKHVALHRSGCSGCSGHWKTGANHIKPRPNGDTPWWSRSHGHGSKLGNPTMDDNSLH